ncbi:MAG: efflux RND transporter periplasmic adaptor subunit [Candidatus Pacebacteria bacterium]|nr:efflux RND transporter periplasmic adaptor subunit [Candidatus Paceibacterota bacterium]
MQMRKIKISYYVVAVVVAGVAITSLFIYERYLKTAPEPFLYFSVDRGDIQEAIKVRSEVVAQKEFELEFPFAGTVEAVYAKDGATVVAGQRLMSLATTDLAIQASQLAAVVTQRKADLAKLLAGATAQDIRVSESKLATAGAAEVEAQASLGDAVRDAYTKSDDAIRAKTDDLFDNPRSTDPKLSIYADNVLTNDLNLRRAAIETMLTVWNASLANLTVASDPSTFIATAESNTALISDFLNLLSPPVANLSPSGTLSQTVIDAYKTDVSTARAEVNTAITNLAAAKEKFKLAESDVALTQQELELAKAPARSEDIQIAQARIEEAQGQLDAVRENISRSTLYAPSAGRVSKVHNEVGEIFRPGTSAISMETSGYKIQADVSELDIAKVAEGGTVRIALDAFPKQEFTGTVASIDAQAIIKTEDKYYRVNIIFDAEGAFVRPGMSADATILSDKKTGILRVPELAVYTDDTGKYVKALLPGLTKAVSEASFQKTPVETGVTDGNFIEIVSGVTEAQTVVVSAQ